MYATNNVDLKKIFCTFIIFDFTDDICNPNEGLLYTCKIKCIERKGIANLNKDIALHF